MAEETHPQTSNCIVGEKCVERKHQENHCLAHSFREGQLDSNTQYVETDSSCGGLDSFSESSDAGILYVNPQTPNWSLVHQFAQLSPGEGTGDCEDAKYHENNNVLMDAGKKRERNCSKHLKSRQVKSDASSKQQASKLKELNVEMQSPEGGGNKARKKSANSASVKKKRNDNKIPRLLVAMKKRSEVDTEHRPFKCTHCHWAFKKLCNLQSHLQTHSGLKPHVCDICGKAYSHQGTLQQHKRLHTGERPYHCPFCAKTYIWSSDYRKHIRTHTGEKPYVCDTCGKDFIRSSDLRKHERNMHTNDKPFPCTHCGKTFNKPLSLKRHERKHLGERPFSCPDCGKAFALASRMAEHQKIHTGVRPYVCSVCSKCFTKSSNLAEHEAIHSGVRPHKCTECGVAFAMASRLVRHHKACTTYAEPPGQECMKQELYTSTKW
ncbi:zinc finger protein 648 [Anabas testudineus]|uniref:zinc finger protein 648 n=1 Tax=Anabas testudineus TaxID=64144 RepID=UPI00143D0714|nr:zinc finger protein 648 [Anabas testudineus]